MLWRWWDFQSKSNEKLQLQLPLFISISTLFWYLVLSIFHFLIFFFGSSRLFGIVFNMISYKIAGSQLCLCYSKWKQDSVDPLMAFSGTVFALASIFKNFPFSYCHQLVDTTWKWNLKSVLNTLKIIYFKSFVKVQYQVESLTEPLALWTCFIIWKMAKWVKTLFISTSLNSKSFHLLNALHW